MRLCVKCQLPLKRNCPSTWCGTCARQHKCRDCGKLKEDLSKTRCTNCRKLGRVPYQRTLYSVGGQGKRPQTPPWVEERILLFQQRVEQGLSLFG